MGELVIFKEMSEDEKNEIKIKEYDIYDKFAETAIEKRESRRKKRKRKKLIKRNKIIAEMEINLFK